jgi:hypothetical protein
MFIWLVSKRYLTALYRLVMLPVSPSFKCTSIAPEVLARLRSRDVLYVSTGLAPFSPHSELIGMDG